MVLKDLYWDDLSNTGYSFMRSAGIVFCKRKKEHSIFAVLLNEDGKKYIELSYDSLETYIDFTKDYKRKEIDNYIKDYFAKNSIFNQKIIYSYTHDLEDIKKIIADADFPFSVVLELLTNIVSNVFSEKDLKKTFVGKRIDKKSLSLLACLNKQCNKDISLIK